MTLIKPISYRLRCYGAAGWNRAHILCAYKYDIVVDWLSFGFGLVVVTACFNLLSEHVSLDGYNGRQLVAYYQLVFVVTYFVFSSNGITYKVWSDINSGELSGILCRPIDYMLLEYVKAVVTGVVFATLGAMTLLGAMCFSGSGLSCKYSVLLPFVVSLFLSFSMQWLILFALGILSLFIRKSLSFREVYFMLGGLLTGQLVPIDLCPQFLQTISLYLPFRHIVFSPIAIFQGHYVDDTPARILATQAAWVLVLILLTRGLYRVGLTRYCSQEAH